MAEVKVNRSNRQLEALDSTRLILQGAKNLRISRIVSAMRKATNRRRMSWHLKPIEAAKLIISDCHYCGTPSHHAIDHVSYNPYNGIDRVDSEGDYTIDNCVPCCGKCNRAKHTLHTEEFKALVARIYNHFCKGN